MTKRQAFDAHKVHGSDIFLQREFPMSGRNYAEISKLVYKHSGIVLIDRKQEMVYGRLARRLRKLGIANFDVYLNLLGNQWSDEGTPFLNALTTNKTSFFREMHHFEHLVDSVIPEIKRRHGAKRLRIWSTAASTGEEPYSIAMVFMEEFANSNWDIKILATDIDSDVLETARRGVYSFERVSGIGRKRLKKWFKPIDDDQYQVHQSLKSLLHFKQLNLLDKWPMKGTFDIVFCRNVIIYFDKDTQRTLFCRIHDHMAENACLYIGHSETLLNVSERFRLLGKTTYRRLHLAENQ